MPGTVFASEKEGKQYFVASTAEMNGIHFNPVVQVKCNEISM